jgi:hypothetical protein
MTNTIGAKAGHAASRADPIEVKQIVAVATMIVRAGSSA